MMFPRPENKISRCIAAVATILFGVATVTTGGRILLGYSESGYAVYTSLPSHFGTGDTCFKAHCTM